MAAELPYCRLYGNVASAAGTMASSICAGPMQDKFALDVTERSDPRNRDRLWVYRILGVLSPLACVLFMAAGLLGPVFDSSTRTYVLAFETVALGASLGFGAREPAHADAPITNSREDAFLAAILALLLLWCVVAVVTSVTGSHR